MIPKNHDEKSHSGTPGSKAACAYPGHFAACRALVQLSSRAILQTAWHVGPFGGVRLAFGETLSFMCASLLPVHGVILRFELIHPSLRNPCGCGVASC